MGKLFPDEKRLVNVLPNYLCVYRNAYLRRVCFHINTGILFQITWNRWLVYFDYLMLQYKLSKKSFFLFIRGYEILQYHIRYLQYVVAMGVICYIICYEKSQTNHNNLL